MIESVPTSDEIRAFLADLDVRRNRLLELARVESSQTTADLIAAIDDIGAQMMIADEELRVQNEELTRSARQLDLLVAAHEDLFANAPTAYIQTDPDGLVVRMNRAARALLGISTTAKRSHTMVGFVSTADRAKVRELTGRVRKQHVVAVSGAAETIDVSLQREDGTQVEATLAARAASDNGTGQRLVHWQLQQRTAVEPTPAVHVPLGDDTAAALQAVAQAASTLADQDTPGMTMREVVAQALAAIPGCDAVGITVLRGKRRLEIPESSGEDAAACDQLQHELMQGPCLDAFDTNAIVRVDDLATDERWPDFAAKATELGVRSVLAVPLIAPKGMLGALNLYAHKPDAFDTDGETIASVFATHAAIALFHSELEANLRMGLSTREEIGRAVGILMERHRVSAARAFDMLVYASQHSHRKLRYIALWVNETGEDPTSLVHER